MWRMPELLPLAAVRQLGLGLEQDRGDAPSRERVGDRRADDSAPDHGDLSVERP